MDTASTDTVTGVAIDTWISGLGLALNKNKALVSFMEDSTTENLWKYYDDCHSNHFYFIRNKT